MIRDEDGSLSPAATTGVVVAVLILLGVIAIFGVLYIDSGAPSPSDPWRVIVDPDFDRSFRCHPTIDFCYEITP